MGLRRLEGVPGTARLGVQSSANAQHAADWWNTVETVLLEISNSMEPYPLCMHVPIDAGAQTTFLHPNKIKKGPQSVLRQPLMACGLARRDEITLGQLPVVVSRGQRFLIAHGVSQLFTTSENHRRKTTDGSALSPRCERAGRPRACGRR